MFQHKKTHTEEALKPPQSKTLSRIKKIGLGISVMYAFSFIITGNYFLSFLMFFCLSIFHKEMTNYILAKYNFFESESTLRTIAGLLIFVTIIGGISNISSVPSPTGSEPENLSAQQESAHLKIKTEFNSNKIKILETLSSQIKSNQFQEAQDTIDKYKTAMVNPDADLLKLEAQLRETQATWTIKNSQSLEDRVKAYAILTQIYPENKKYKKEYATTIKAFVEQERISSIKSQFSGISGAHHGLNDYIKANMNDPDSFEHVKTTYIIKKQNFTVYTFFRGKNVFGATVLNAVSAEITPNGDILSIQYIH